MRTDDPLPSRAGLTSPYGKLDDRIEAYAIENLVKVRLVELASAEGLPLSEYQREVNRIIAFGPEHEKKIRIERIDRIAKKLGLSTGE